GAPYKKRPPRLSRYASARAVKIEMTPRSLRAMKRHAGRDYPYECCGFLVGRAEQAGASVRGDRKVVIEEALPTENMNRERAHDRYEIHPLAYKRLEDSLTGTGREILGFYHSHPDHPSRPSVTDLEFFGGWPGYIYVIVGVDGKGHRPKGHRPEGRGKTKKYRVTAWSMEEALEEHELVTG
ncbi:MAG: M67 family metallopeptidase, partial [Nitrospinota bacterium]